MASASTPASAPSTPSPISVLVISDPGLPSSRTNAAYREITDRLQKVLKRPVFLELRTEMLKLDPQGTLSLRELKRISNEYPHIDVTIMVTEIPRNIGLRPLQAETFIAENVAIVSFPTLGAMNLKKRLTKVLVGCVVRMLADRGDNDHPAQTLKWTQRKGNGGANSYIYLTHTTVGGPRTVLGMTVGNSPWRIAPQLSSALAAAMGIGAFGIFYSSIWSMSDALSTMRLAMIALLSVVFMTVWLMFSNRLWDSPRQESYARAIALYNMSTLFTLLLCIVALYVSLSIIIFLAALVVIDPGFMEQILGKEPTIMNYLDIAWLSAALGTVAGSLGASFDSDADIRQLTHGRRERQREYVLDEPDEEFTDYTEYRADLGDQRE